MPKRNAVVTYSHKIIHRICKARHTKAILNLTYQSGRFIHTAGEINCCQMQIVFAAYCLFNVADNFGRYIFNEIIVLAYFRLRVSGMILGSFIKS